MSSETDQLTAEQRFRQAFERLRADKPKVLSPGTPVSQNNVAKEAGCDTSALRKSRFPSLVRQIQEYVKDHHQKRPSKRQDQLRKRKSRAKLRLRLDEVASQRDHAQSQLASANRRIVELSDELRIVRMQLDQLRPPTTPLNR
jgi:chromosome segregation ATPase